MIRQVTDLSTFSKHENLCRSHQVFWFDFRKILREHKNGQRVLGRDRLFTDFCLNPESSLVKGWKKFMFLVAIYYFLAVPVTSLPLLYSSAFSLCTPLHVFFSCCGLLIQFI